MPLAEQGELPALIDLVTAGRALGLGRTKSYELARTVGQVALLLTSPPYGQSTHGQVRSTCESGHAGVRKYDYGYGKSARSLARGSHDRLVTRVSSFVMRETRKAPTAGHQSRASQQLAGQLRVRPPHHSAPKRDRLPPGGCRVPGQRIRLDPVAEGVPGCCRSAPPPVHPPHATGLAEGARQLLCLPGPVGGERR